MLAHTRGFVSLQTTMGTKDTEALTVGEELQNGKSLLGWSGRHECKRRPRCTQVVMKRRRVCVHRNTHVTHTCVPWLCPVREVPGATARWTAPKRTPRASPRLPHALRPQKDLGSSGAADPRNGAGTARQTEVRMPSRTMDKRRPKQVGVGSQQLNGKQASYKER